MVKWLKKQKKTKITNPPANAGNTGDMGSIPGSGQFPGGGNGTPRQYFCLENSVDRGAWWAAAPALQSWARLSMFRKDR